MKRLKGTINKAIRIFLMCSLSLAFLGGCGKEKSVETKVVFTTGFGKEEIFRIENISCTTPEVMVYLTNTQNQYEEVFGEEIWNTQLDGVTLQENVKETVLAKIAQVKTMNLLASERGISLSDDEKALIQVAAEEYFGSLNETEISKMSISLDTVTQLYSEYALAEKVYSHIIKDINPEISDDEARIITVEHILIKTYTLDGTGKKVSYTESTKLQAYERAGEILEKATSGSKSFEELIASYSEDAISTYSFGKGEMDEAFEKAAFDLGTNEISGIVESEYGYHIIKCLNTFDREETDNNKLKIVEQRKQEVFGQEYDAFVQGLTRNINQTLWETIGFIHDDNVNTAIFFDIYSKYF